MGFFFLANDSLLLRVKIKMKNTSLLVRNPMTCENWMCWDEIRSGKIGFLSFIILSQDWKKQWQPDFIYTCEHFNLTT